MLVMTLKLPLNFEVDDFGSYFLYALFYVVQLARSLELAKIYYAIFSPRRTRRS